MKMNKETWISLIKSIPYYEQRSEYNQNLKFELLPVLDKKTVIENYDAFQNKKTEPTNILKTVTSGSTGMPLEISWKKTDYCQSMLHIWRIRRKLGINPDDLYCSVHVAFNNKGKLYTNKVVIQDNNISLSKCYADNETYKYYYEIITEYKPKWMLVQPSFLYAFLIGLHNMGLCLPLCIKHIELTGEYCHNNLLLWFKQNYPYISWKIVYGMQEFNVIGYGDDNTLDILSDNVYVEIINRVNDIGDIVVTGLTNTIMPLIRYRTGDKGYFNQDGKLVITQAKSNDTINFASQTLDGSIFWLIILLANTRFGNVIKQFQVHLKNKSLVFMLVCEPYVDKKETTDFITDFLSRKYQCSYTVEVSFVTEISPFSFGNKIKYFINWNNQE